MPLKPVKPYAERMHELDALIAQLMVMNEKLQCLVDILVKFEQTVKDK